MNEKIKKMISDMSLDELRDLRGYIDDKIQNDSHESWNSRIVVDEFCDDYQLREVLDKNSIHNMDQFKKNGLSNIPESLVEKANWTLQMFDFDRLENQYRKK